MVVGDDDERPSLVRVESDRPVDRHPQVVLELSAENRMIKTRQGSSGNFTSESKIPQVQDLRCSSRAMAG